MDGTQIVPMNKWFQQLLEKEIRPTKHEIKVLKSDVNRISNIGRSNLGLPISETFVGGSFGRRTMIKGRQEIDIVFFLNKKPNKIEYEKARDKVHKSLSNAFPNEKTEILDFAIRLKRKGRKIDVLIGLTASTPEMVANQVMNGNKFYQVSNGKFHKQLLNSFHASARDRIMIAKYWLAKNKGNLSYSQLPPSFGLELLVLLHMKTYRNKLPTYPYWFRDFLGWLSNKSFIGTHRLLNSQIPFPPANKFGLVIVDPGNPIKNVVGKWQSCNDFVSLAKKSYKETDWEKVFT